MLVWLPPDLDAAALGPLPERLERGSLPAEGPVPPRADEVEVLVLDPQQRGRLVEVLPSLTGLRLVQTLNAGVDWVPQLDDGVTLCNASGVHDGPVADWVLGAVLAQEKRLLHFAALQARGEWDREANLAFGSGPPAGDLAEQTVLIVGYGSIGAAVERRFASCGSRILRIASRAREQDGRQVHGPTSLPDLLPEADVVVVLAPASPETVHLVDAGFLAAMRAGALLVNAARGSLVDPVALLDAATAGRVRACLDVTEPEPLPAGDPLWHAPGVTITPHVAGSSAHWRQRAYALVGDQLRRYAAGERVLNVRRDGESA